MNFASLKYFRLASCIFTCIVKTFLDCFNDNYLFSSTRSTSLTWLSSALNHLMWFLAGTHYFSPTHIPQKNSNLNSSKSRLTQNFSVAILIYEISIENNASSSNFKIFLKKFLNFQHFSVHKIAFFAIRRIDVCVILSRIFFCRKAHNKVVFISLQNRVTQWNRNVKEMPNFAAISSIFSSDSYQCLNENVKTKYRRVMTLAEK